MAFFSEIAVTVIGGLITAVILALFTRRGKEPARSPSAQQNQSQRRTGGSFGQFMHVLLSVVIGIVLATTLGRYLFRSGILERSPETRLIVAVCAIILVWLVINMLRGRR